MDQVTQHNAALVEQASSAVATLQDQALNLSHAVGVFQLEAPTAAATVGHANVLPLRSIDGGRINPAPALERAYG